MKNLLTAVLLFAATSIFAVEGPPPPVYCDCVGIGMPEKKAPHINTDTSTSKAAHLSFAQRAFYEIELWAMIFEHSLY